MSHQTYNKLWAEAQKTLEDATQVDTILQTAKPQKDKRAAHQVVSELYVKYITVVNKLDQCYDQILQPQKRVIIRRLLDASIGRLLEMKHELVNLDMSEFSYYDPVLLNMKLLPHEAEVCVPKYYRREREQEIQSRKKFMDDVLKKLGYVEEEVHVEEMTDQQAIRLIQIHERARQGRLRSQFMKEIRLLKEKGKPETQTEVESSSSMMAALSIQKTWRGYIARRKIMRRKFEEMLLIGMVQPSSMPTEARQTAAEIQQVRRYLQDKYQVDYEKAVENEKELCRKNRGGQMMEEMTDAIRSWYMQYKSQSGKFPDFPSEELGGSAMLFRSSSRQGTESSMSKSTAGSSGGKSKKDKGKKALKEDLAKKKREDEDEDPGFKMAPSNFLTDLLTVNTEFDTTWRSRLNDPNEEPYYDMIKAEKQAEVEAELRKIVDNMMREELEVLQAALDRDRAKKGKKGKRSSKKKKGRRGGKKSKKKKEKDLTPDRTTESLFEELITNGIIKKYPEVPLSAFRGERSYANYELRQMGKDPLPALGDIRQVIMEYCVLPLGSKFIHQNSPLVRSLLIAGPRDSGKDMLVHAICTEIGAVLFDLSPANIVGKYPGKSGLIMLVHLVSKVSSFGAWMTCLHEGMLSDSDWPGQFVMGPPKSFIGSPPTEGKVFVNGASSERHTDEIYRRCSEIGPILQLRVPRTKNRERLCGERIKDDLDGIEPIDDVIVYRDVRDFEIFRGFAFLKFENHYLARTAIFKLKNGLLPNVCGSKALVLWARSESIIPEDLMKSVRDLFIRNILPYMTHDHLYKYISDIVGSENVKRVRLTLKPGFAYVHFYDRATAQTVLDHEKSRSGDQHERMRFDWSKPEACKPSYHKQFHTKMDKSYWKIEIENRKNNTSAKLLQPAVIYMDGAEKPFMKKVPKTDKTDPKRLKKDLPKLIKTIGSDDQVMLIGVSNTPWECDQKALQQTYNKFILVPRPDYARSNPGQMDNLGFLIHSLSFLWMELLFQYSGVSRQFDVGAMAKLADGYTFGSIIKVVKDVMTCKRILQLVVQPLNHYELVNSLSKFQPVYKEEDEAYVQWLSKTPLGRKKARYLELLAERLALATATQAIKKRNK